MGALCYNIFWYLSMPLIMSIKFTVPLRVCRVDFSPNIWIGLCSTGSNPHLKQYLDTVIIKIGAFSPVARSIVGTFILVCW